MLLVDVLVPAVIIALALADRRRVRLHRPSGVVAAAA
ncbi:hypothetical protein [Tsukamurella spumae]